MKTVPNTSGNMSTQQENINNQPPGTGETIATTPPKNWWGIAGTGLLVLLAVGAVVLSIVLPIVMIRFFIKRANG